MNHFKQELHVRERYSSVTEKTAEKQILDESTTSSFVARHDNVSCVYCLGQHASSKCTKKISVEARFARENFSLFHLFEKGTFKQEL